MLVRMGGLKISLICLLFIASCAEGYRSTRSELAQVEPDLISTLSTVIVEWISKCVQYISELFDLKVRSVRFLSSLYTTDNLVLLKKFINIGLRFGNWVYSIIPDSTNEGAQSFVAFLFPELSAQREEQEEEDPSSVSVSSYDSSSSLSRSNDFNKVEDDKDDNYVDRYGKQVMDLHTLINSRSNFQ